MATLTSSLILRLRDGVTGPARRVGQTMDRLRRDVDRTNRANMAMAAGAGRALRNMALMGGAYLGLGVGSAAAIQGAMNMEDAIANLAKVSTLTQAELAAMKDRAVEISGQMPIAATEIVNLVAAASQFGIAKEDLEEFALTAAKAAVAFDMDPSSTSQALSELKNSYKLTMEELTGLADAINFTADTAGTSETRLIDFLNRTGASAQSYGISAEAMLAYGASLNEIGIESSKAATGLSSMTTKIANLSAYKGAMKMLDAVGGKGYSARLQKKFYDNPVEAMNDLWKLSAKMTKEQRSGFFLEFFGLEYGDDAAAIVENIDKIIKRQEDLADSTKYAGSVQKTFDTFASTTSNKLKVLQNSLSNVTNAVGAKLLPTIASFAERLSVQLGSLDESVNVFDHVGERVRSFMDGLGVDGEALQKIYDGLWTGVFGDPDQLESDAAALGKAVEHWRAAGEAIREFVDGLFALATAIPEFFGATPEQAADVLSALGTGALTLAIGAAGLSVAAKAIRLVAGALYFLSGAAFLLGGAKGIAKIFGAVAGAGAAAAVAGGTVGADGDKKSKGKRGRGFWRKLTGVPMVAALAASSLLGGGTSAPEGGDTGGIPGGIVGSLQDQWAKNSKMGNPATFAGEQSFQMLSANLAEQREAAGDIKRYLDDIEANEVEPKIDSAKIVEAQGVADSFSKKFGAIGDISIKPLVDPSSINSANGSALKLLQSLRSLDALGTVRPRARGPGIEGARASGGPVWPGKWLVGEDGPELLDLDGSGFVHNARDTRNIMDGLSLPRGIGGSAKGSPSQATPTQIGVTFAPGSIVVSGISDPQAAAEAILRRAGTMLRGEMSGAYADLEYAPGM